MGWVKHASPEVEAESQWPMIVAVTTVLTVLSIVVVSWRLIIRHRARGLALDDQFSALAMVFAVIYSVLAIIQTQYGLGLSIASRPVENLSIYTKVNYAGRPIYQLGISFFKIALLISYLRLLQGTQYKHYRTVVWVVAGLIFLSHVGCTFALIFACDPIAKSWDVTIAYGKCLPVGASFTGYAVVTIVSDLIVTFLPIPVLLKLNIKTEKKLGLVVVFFLGIFTTVCSVMRYTQINRIQFGDGNSTMLVLWGCIEFNTGNIVSSLPFLAPVCLRRAKEYRSYKSGGAYGQAESHGIRGGRSGDRYKLSKMSQKKDDVHYSSSGDSDGQTKHGTSQENILAPRPENSIIKSMTYTVRVDQEDGHSSRSQGDASSADGEPRAL